MLTIGSKMCGQPLSHSIIFYVIIERKKNAGCLIIHIIYSIKTLIVNTIFIHVNTGNIHIGEYLSLAVAGADYNRCL